MCVRIDSNAMCDAKTSESDSEAQGERGMDTNECRIYLNTWRQTQESKSNSSQQKGLSGVVWCGEVVWCMASGGEVDGKGDVTRLDCTRSVRVVLTLNRFQEPF